MQIAITFIAVVAGLVFFRGGGVAGGRIYFRAGDSGVFVRHTVAVKAEQKR